jgi:hypothetical protein
MFLENFIRFISFKEKEKILLVCLLVKVEERTNKRFHVSGLIKRLSTAFDSVTLYGNDPHLRPDIYGKLVMLEFLFVV